MRLDTRVLTTAHRLHPPCENEVQDESLGCPGTWPHAALLPSLPEPLLGFTARACLSAPCKADATRILQRHSTVGLAEASGGHI